MDVVASGEVLVPAGETLLAHPIAVLAIPAFIPVVVIVVTILWVARKDRLEAAAEAGSSMEEVPGEAAPSTDAPRPDPVAHDREPALAAVSASSPVEAPSSDAAPPEPRRSWRDRLPRLVIGDEE